MLLAEDKFIKDCNGAKAIFQKNGKAVASFPNAAHDMDNCTEDVLDNRRPLERAMETKRNRDGGPLSPKDSTQL